MYTLIGIVGAVLVFFGFYRTSIGRWSGKSFWYEMDNFVGAIFITIYQIHYHALVSVVVNIIWAVVAFRGLISYRERRQKP